MRGLGSGASRRCPRDTMDEECVLVVHGVGKDGALGNLSRHVVIRRWARTLANLALAAA